MPAFGAGEGQRVRHRARHDRRGGGAAAPAVAGNGRRHYAAPDHRAGARRRPTGPQGNGPRPRILGLRRDDRRRLRCRSDLRSEEHTSELQSLMRISYAVFCLKKKTQKKSEEGRKKHNTIRKEKVTYKEKETRKVRLQE